jgi:predicted Kef-type K+ transport protein
MASEADLMPPEGQSLVVAGALLTITLNPLVFYAAGRWPWSSRPSRLAAETKQASVRRNSLCGGGNP